MQRRMSTNNTTCPALPTPSCTAHIDDEDLTLKCCVPISSLAAPIEVGKIGSGGRAGTPAFFAWPPLGPLLFENETSDARDHCANERTFLSYIRLSVFMAVLSVAITLSFHLKHKPTDLERRVSKPLGGIFWILSVLMLALGVANYIKTVNEYSRRAAIVQTGWRTQLILGMVAFCIVGTCVVLLAITKMRQQEERLL
ncbi:hypothetical protein C2857_007221 [Epichloe festucae Fl1]|uniref:DUF202 domain-containing protein n=1 Tax=Epichloe festucae (strain Fl1) TaxID=877507 RepID=A0A7S9KMB1_EPIFF|nr:hypothetical protein C2857_007221 [Epichloe festucae Fl1]